MINRLEDGHRLIRPIDVIVQLQVGGSGAMWYEARASKIPSLLVATGDTPDKAVKDLGRVLVDEFEMYRTATDPLHPFTKLLYGKLGEHIAKR